MRRWNYTRSSRYWVAIVVCQYITLFLHEAEPFEYRGDDWRRQNNRMVLLLLLFWSVATAFNQTKLNPKHQNQKLHALVRPATCIQAHHRLSTHRHKWLIRTANTHRMRNIKIVFQFTVFHLSNWLRALFLCCAEYRFVFLSPIFGHH